MHWGDGRGLGIAVLVAATALGGCGRPLNRGPTTPPPATTAVGAPLPAGWAWPVNPQTLAQGLASLGVYRPLNVAALQAMQGAPCPPVEVAPSVWVKPLCAKLPPLALSAAAEDRPPAPRSFAPLPPNFDLRDAGLDGPVKDQQQAGVCWSFALSTLMDNAVRRAGRADVLAPLHLIAHDEYRLLFKKGAGLPIVLEPSWPYDPHKACKLDEDEQDAPYCWNAYQIQSGTWRYDPALVAERARAETSGVYRIIKLQRLTRNGVNPEELARVIADGQAIYAGFDIDMQRWRNRNLLSGAVIADWDPDNSGGHAVALVGYRMTPFGRQFRIHNSWGADWGDHGYAWVSERMVLTRIHDAFTVAVGDAAGQPLSSQGAPPGPIPTPSPPSAAGCAPGSVRDALLGLCFQPCPDGNAPVLGICPPPGVTLPPSQPSGPPPPAQPPPSTAGCAPGSVRDRVLGVCFQPCPDGGAPLFGVCAPGNAGAPPACAAGQLADLLTRQCAAACPSGSPRIGGICWF